VERVSEKVLVGAVVLTYEIYLYEDMKKLIQQIKLE
jgi:hypothetical protein